MIIIAATAIVCAVVGWRNAMTWKKREGLAVDSLKIVQAGSDKISDEVESIRIHCCIERAQLQQLTEVLNVFRDGVIVVNTHGEVMYANKSASSVLNVSSDEVSGRPISEIVHGDELVSKVIAAQGGIPDEGTVFEYEITSDSQSTIFEVRMHTVGNFADQTPTIVVQLRDMTHDREISQLKSDFVSKASHELRTPICSIAAYIEMLIDGDAEDDEAIQEYYSVISKETGRLQKMIDNLLDISRIEAGLMNIDRKYLDVGELVNRAVTNLNPQAQLKDTSIHVQLAEVNLSALVDGDMLYQVIVNLLSNAIKYTPNGGRITIDVDSDNLTKSLHFSITDTGLGISPDDIEKVFDKFYRIENYQHNAQGTGLGLNLCSHIIESLHNGQLGLESTLGKGSRFWFTVPIEGCGAKAAA